METNNIVSLYEARGFCDDEMLMLESDIYYKKELLEQLLKGKGDCVILTSPFNIDTMNGSAIRSVDGKAIELILGAWQEAGFDYSKTEKTVNIYKFSKEFVKDKYMPLVEWYVNRMGEESYYEKVLGSIIYYRECDIRTVCVPESMWCEVDNMEDLKSARRIFG